MFFFFLTYTHGSYCDPSLYFCWAVLVMPSGSRVLEQHWIHVEGWLTDQRAELGLNLGHWNLKSLLLWNIKLPSRHQKQKVFRNSFMEINTKEGAWFPHQPSPSLCDVKILHFTWPFLYNFSINPKTAFTEGRFWTEHNFHFTASD